MPVSPIMMATKYRPAYGGILLSYDAYLNIHVSQFYHTSPSRSVTLHYQYTITLKYSIADTVISPFPSSARQHHAAVICQQRLTCASRKIIRR